MRDECSSEERKKRALLTEKKSNSVHAKYKLGGLSFLKMTPILCMSNVYGLKENHVHGWVYLEMLVP